MADKNEVILEGILKSDPVLKQVGAKQTNVCKFTIITEDGKYKSYHNCQSWKEKATDHAENYREGDRVKAHGSLSYSSYEKDGRKVYVTNITILGMKKVSDGVPKNAKPQDVPVPDDDESLPF